MPTTQALFPKPLTRHPAVEEVEGTLRLVHGDHVTGLVDAHKGKIARRLDLAILLLLAGDGQAVELGPVEALLAGPLESLSPGLVTEPVANEIGIASVDEDGDLLENLRHEAVEGLHPVTLEEEVAVDVKVAAVVAGNFSAESIHDILLVEVLADPAQGAVAEVAAILALSTDIVDVLAGSLIRANESIVTVDRGGDTAPHTSAVIAVLNEALATRERVIHALALGLVQDGGVATLAASHGAVMLVLGESISQAVANQDRLEVDVAVLVRQDLRGKDGNVVSSIRLARNVEVLLGILGELVEEQSQKSVDILASGNGVADRASRVRVSNIDRLIEEDYAGVLVPAKIIVDNLELLVDGRRAEFQEQAGKGRAAGAAIEPEDDGIVLGVVAGLEEP